MATKRLIKELDAYNRDPSPALISLEPENDDLQHLSAVLKGPEDTAYEGGQFHLSISVPSQYPSAPPTVTFRTPCCHPNISLKTGEICLDLLKDSWTPAYGVVTTLEAVSQLLSAGANPDSPLNLDAAKLVREGDVVGYEGMVRFWVGRYAIGR